MARLSGHTVRQVLGDLIYNTKQRHPSKTLVPLHISLELLHLKRRRNKLFLSVVQQHEGITYNSDKENMDGPTQVA